MAYTTVDLEMAESHISLGEKHIVEQEMLITIFTAKGYDTVGAERLLELFVDMLKIHRDHRDMIASKLQRSGPPAARGPRD
ncbi:hypothetical protein [Rhizobium sp. NXC24]|uniref:hypothetical protein n=1 Tax=Rhizobium sp. NXC24 TaxID=2048897 RepID=UPI000CF29CD0|nr:hypothetical protein [Rhizobium sp. NXC24]